MALVDRVKNILLTPTTEWPVIEAETTTVADLYRGYVVPLAAIGPLAYAIGMAVFGLRVPGLGTFRTPVGTVITQALAMYVATLVGVYVLALVVDAIAPTFGGTQNRIQALKLVAYSWTAAWLAGLFGLIPTLSWLGLLAFYSLYLLYLGLPVLMKAPADKAFRYTVVVILSAIVVYVLIGFVVGLFVRPVMA
jgi:hypothetical protein